MARVIGARCAFIQTDRGQPLALLSWSPLSVEGVSDALRGRVRWFTFCGRKVELAPPRLGGAIDELRRAGRAVTLEALGELLGVTERTLRRYASAEGLRLADVVEVIPEVAAAAAPAPVEPVTTEVEAPLAPPPLPPLDVPDAVLRVTRLDERVDVPAHVPAHLRHVWATVAGDGTGPERGKGLLAAAMLDGLTRHQRGALDWLEWMLWGQDRCRAYAQEMDRARDQGPPRDELILILRRAPLGLRRRLILARWSQWQEHVAWGDEPGPWCWVELAQHGVSRAMASALIEGASVAA